MSNQLFNKVQFNKPSRNVFNLSHERKFSMKMGELTPIFCEEVIPGDKFQISSEALIRFAPMLAPIMHRVNVFTHFFYVPNRIVWEEWEDFITGGADGTANPVLPYLNCTSSSSDYLKPTSLADYLGVATTKNSITESGNINALPFRAYQKIWNEYYRDQDLQDEVEVSTSSGSIVNPERDILMSMRKRAWEKDYFTSSRPWTQKGGDVEIPILGNAPVVMADNTDWVKVKNVDGSQATDSALRSESGNLRGAGAIALKLDPMGTLDADLSSVTSATIAELRTAIKTQEWLERNARGGSRYIEQMLSHFGVRSSDARLQRPEYLGGGKVPVLISETLQTSQTDTSPQGNLAGHGVSAGQSPRFEMYAEEHGYIMGIMSILPKTTYQQGFRRHFLKNDRFDYFWPSFENVGEQPVYDAELYHQYNTPISLDDTFGYQSRYSEYKTIPNSVHGDFKDTLEFWHMGRIFDSKPVLNSDFIESDPTQRIFAVNDSSNKLWCQVYNHVKAIRPISRMSNPHI